MNDEWLSEEWQRLLREAYLCARGQRLTELSGRHIRRFDESGLHPYSFIIGQLSVLENLLDLPNEVRVHPVTLREAAIEEANSIFAERLKTEGARAFTSGR